ncbi:kinase-like protein, partial [Auricularia subglabra TFB-10046 SS5]
LISPFMRNGNLIQYLRLFPDMDRRPLLQQVATAVEFLHSSCSMIHGDIKCENILISDNGTAMLADFGLSTFIDVDTTSRTLTGSRRMMSIRFAAPELVIPGETGNGTEETDRPPRKTPATDVYAFGMTIIQAFTGRAPWDGCTDIMVIMNIYQRKTHPRPAVTCGLCDQWWNLCVKCCAHHPWDRPTMVMVLHDLNPMGPCVVPVSGNADAFEGLPRPL